MVLRYTSCLQAHKLLE